MWRPEGWKTEEVKENPLHCLAPQVCADHFFEAGADAMLKALETRGLYITFDGRIIDEYVPKERE